THCFSLLTLPECVFVNFNKISLAGSFTVLHYFWDERDKVQKKTFTKWINQHLMKVSLYFRLASNALGSLPPLPPATRRLRQVPWPSSLHPNQEATSIDPREKGRMRFHRLQNVQIALDYLKKRQVKLVNIRNDDITDGNPKLTLGLIWTIILHFQISDIHVTGESEDMSAKERLLLWTQQTTEGYATIRCENFTTCWRDGKLFNAIIHKYRPDLVDMSTVAVQSNLANLEHAFYVAEKLGVTRLLDPEDVDVSSPDEKSVITYVSSLYDAFPKVPEGGEGISANDVEVKWVEYQNMVNYLIQWIRHHVTIMSDRTFPNNPVELKALYNQYLQFKETEIPPKEIDKSKIKRLYKLLEVWIEFGRIKLPQGYHPNDIEKEWGKLIIAMLEREKTIRPEVERLEMLQQIANRVQRDSLGCEDKLILARNALQSDAKRLESGLQFQNEAEIAGCLLECENLLRQQVIDVQILIDGKYYQADQLIQRYFIFLFKCLTSRLTPTITPAYAPGFPSRVIQTYVTGVDSNALQTLKLMQIRKPLMKSAFVDQNLSEEEVNMKFVQDLLNWVDEMQVQLDRAEWGSDLPSVESHLENHKNVLRAIEEFESSLKEAKISEIQMTAPLKLSYAEKLHKLESQYAKLLNTSRNQERHLDTLHNFVSRATAVLIWLNEKEEEEVAYDWSERNSNISRKKEYHAVSDLMRELDQKEEVIKSVQEIAEQLLLENHPARLTIEAYRAAMQTQWSWILQLCHCVEQHLRENAAYFEFFNDAKEAMDYLKNLKDAIQRKYTCDRYSSLHKLEDLVQESMEEKEQLLQYKSTVAGLVGKAKTIIQLKPRNPDSPLKTSIPIKAICDYRQIEITIYKDDECVLASNSHRAKWKVISPSGNEAMVPSVCFTVPPPNKEAIDTANRIEQHFQNVLALWHESHINMKSVVSWHNLMHEIETVRAGNVIKTMLPGEHQQVLSNLQSRFDDFLEDSQDSKIFSGSDIAQLEKEVNVCKQYYQELLKSAEREEQEESIYNLYISEVRNIRLRLENCEDRLIRQIRTPLERDDLHESVFRISEQELKKELDRLKDDLEMITDKCEEFFSQAAGSPSVPTLRSELNVIIQNMNQVYSMSSIYIEKLKTVNLVLKNTQGAESLVKLYETKLCEEEAVTADKNNIENLMGTLKQWRSEVDEKREVFHALEDELQKAKAISDQMFKTHKERDLDFDWHKEKADQLAERWQNVHSQIENRLRDLEGINKSLKYYKDTYHTLDTWIQQVEDTQRKIQENQPENSKALAKQLNQQKRVLITFPTPLFLQDYELQTMTYRAMVESQQKSPVKRRRMQSSSDFIIQEFMDLRTRYSALVTLMTQYIKFAGDSLKRLEEEEVGHKKSEIVFLGSLFSDMPHWKTEFGLYIFQISTDEIAAKKEQISEALQTTQSFLAKHSDKYVKFYYNEVQIDHLPPITFSCSSHKELQKDMQASALALAEIVKKTEMFLKENGEKLSQEDKTILEQKLNEAKTKCLLLSQKAEESKKNLDKAVTTAIKQETEKVAAIEQLEESKHTIENLLDWLSNVDKTADHEDKKWTRAIEQNGTHFKEGDVKALEGEEDEVNGNLLELEQQTETHAQHEKIISQQQAVIIATQSAQALLEKQGHYLSSEEKEKMQRNMKELKVQYETALAESERKMKLTHSLQEEFEKFDTDYREFENWVQQSEQELENLEAGASDFRGITAKLKRQKSFSEDVISHKGDLRYITISGQRVLDAAKSCSKKDGGKVDKDDIDTSATYMEVQSKLDSASDRFKSLYTKCGILGNNLKDLVDKYQHYEEASSGLLSGLRTSETAVNKQLSEPIAVDPKNLQRQLEETKVKILKKLKKELLVVGRAKQSIIIEVIKDQILASYVHILLLLTLNLTFIITSMQNCCFFQMLEQDIAGRQSSINAMNEKVNKFIETTDPSTASSLQAKMNELSVRFSEASSQHKEKLAKMEELKTKVELFEGLTEKLQSFLDKKTQALNETDAPGKDVTEVSQYITELIDHKKDLEVLHQLLEELSVHGLPGDKALVLEKLNALTKKFKEVEETVKEKEEDASSCQEQMDTFKLLVDSLKKWMKTTTDRIPAVQPSLNTEDLKKPLEDIRVRDSPEIQKMNNRGTSLCNLISAVTSPAKSRISPFPPTELTAVQEAMSDVNHSYEDLGVLLKEKFSELESMLSKMQSVQEESNSVMQWLQTMDKAAASWEAAPTDSEAVRAQVEQHKLFETELKQSENKVQELKDKVTELLEKNPDSSEAPKWKQMLDKIELNRITADRRQNLEESSNYLTQFQMTEAQLKQWLTEKELMVSVLGPLSIDPNMLNTQKQQVQILLKEFDTRKPQYEQLTTAGQGILKTPGEHPPSHEIVKRQLAAVTQKWESLTGQLSDRYGQIDQAIVKSKEYQSLLRNLSDKLNALDNKLTSTLAVSTQPNTMKQQLEMAKELKQEIEQEMKNIKVAQALCEELSVLVREEYLKAELSRQLEAVKVMLYFILSLAGRHVQQLQSAYATSHQFQQMSKDFQTWLDKKKEELNLARPISAKLDSLQLLIGEQKDFKKTLSDQISSYEKIVAEGESLLQKTQGTDRAELQSQLGMLKSNWDEMNKQVKERQDKLNECLEKALKYKEHVENLQPWIEKCQNNLSEIRIVIDPVEIENSIAQVKVWEKDLDKHHSMVELLNNAADSLLNATQTDKESITDEKEVLNQKMDMVTEQLHNKRESLENMARRLKAFQESSRDTKRQLKSTKEQLEAHDALGSQACSNKHLTMLQSQQKALQNLKPHVHAAKNLAQELVVEASNSAGVSDLLLQAESLEQEYSTVSQQVEDKCSFLETKLQGIGHFQNTIREMFSQFAEFDDELDSMAPVGRDLDTLRSQREDIKNFLKKLEDLITSNKNANKTCKMMLATEASPDLVGIKRDLEALSKQCNKLLDRAKAREEQVEGTISRIEEFYSKLKEFSSLLGGAEEHEESQGPVGMETDTINQQLNIFKVFQKEEIEPLLVKQQEVNWLGQGLIQSAAKNASTENLEHDLEDVNTRWKTLNKKVIILYIHKFNFTFPCFVFSPICDEVVIIQDKLEGIKARYKDITKLSSDVSKTLEQALQLAGQLQSTHEELCVWLDKVEVELLSYDAQIPKGEELSQTQERQKELKKEAKNNKGLLDTLNEVSSALLELVPWRAREGLDKMVTEDNERYRLVSNTLNQKVEEIDAAILRSQQFDQAADAELAWIAETEEKLMSLGDIRLEQDQTATQLQVQKAFTMEILRHKDAIDELVESGDEIMNTCTEEEKQSMKKKLESLLQKYEMVCQMNAERNLQLERAQSLVNQFWETYEELWPWLTKTEMVISQLPAPALEYELLKQQQEEHRQLRELIAEHKPHIDKMNKTGPQLLELSPGEGFCIQEKYVAADTLYSQIKEDVKKRALALDEAISQSTQFHDKIDPTLESLERIVERLRQPPSISAEVEKIKEQISENKNVSVDLEKLQPVYETLKQRGEEMIARSEGADKDVSAKAVQDKLKQMVFIWEEIQVLTEEREAKLLDVMELAEKFWCDHMALVITIKDTQDFIRELEGPGVDPSVVKQQQEGAEAIREEVDGLQEELDIVVNLGSELIAACGEPDKPIVNKSIDELNSAWDTLNKAWKERVDKLDEAMQAAVQYQDGLQAIFDWVDIAGSKLASMSPVGTDLETVKQQTEELKQFKTEAYQQQIEMERLNHQAELLLKKVTEESDKHTVQDPLSELRLMWVNLEEKIINRQHKLEGALLALGQFQHALDELLTWLTHTEDLLNEQKPVGGDPKAIEIELAKHHVLQNDVLAHQSTVETVRKAGNDLIESSAVEEASNLQSKLELLNQRWENVLKKTEQRKQQLDSALIQAQGFHGEVEDMHQWLTDTERLLLASKPVGGLPETAREQLNTHMELCAAFEAKEETYKRLMQKGLQMLARCPESAETNVEQDINNLKVKWDSVQTKLSERKIKLEEALNLAMEFHNSLQDFINWLTQAEQTLTMASRPSLILDTILFQIDEHKVFATEVNSHRDQIIELDKIGTHLKYFSQKQDVVLIKNLLISVQSRWEKVVQRLVERGRALDDARKRSKQFHEAWNKLMAWLEESEKLLDSELEIANDPDKIKMQLTQHKEFQKSLGAKHSVYDTTNRTGRSLKEKTSLADDNLKLDDMLSELRDKWDTICGKSVERQNKLEEALLFSGQFTDALQALIDWLYKIEPQLAEDQPVHGDIDLVMNLIDNHKVFQKELGKRTSSVQALKRSARELIEGSRDDSSWVKVQMQELSTRWETVCALSVSKQTRLEQALHQAEEFHSVVHVLLEWLAEAEQALRFHGILPDDDEALRALIDQHREFMRKLEDKKAELNKATGMGEAILAICHPDSITTIKHWITIIRARFEEVLAWAKQHQQRLAGALAGLIAKQELLEALLSWLQWAETTLSEKDKEVIPQEIEDVKALIAEHQMFMEEMTRKQPDVDKVTKTYKRKTVEPTPAFLKISLIMFIFLTLLCLNPPPPPLLAQIETKNPRVNLLVSKWQQVWLLALERRRKLNDALDRLEELREFANFDFDIWRKKYMRWMNHKKSRVMDFFRRIDKDQDGKITRQEFIDGILSSKFPTSRLEMSAVADIFDRDGDGYIDYYEFVAALHPNKDAYKPLTDADKIEDEVTRQVAKCKCAKRFQVEQIGDNKYRVSLHNTSMFGDSQQLRLVRILRSTVMVRVGGGWMALDEFLVKNDPCRAKGRTNMELREKFILADAANQNVAAFRTRGRRSRPSSRGASPNRSTSVSSHAGQGASPQTPHHLTRNYGKPWLTNSKTSTPSKPPDSSEYQGSSSNKFPSLKPSTH
uniref:Dystonin n=1 Tax=Pelusios castaneus TaxID=367368 RepID=A0A8C8S767_9SAUR